MSEENSNRDLFGDPINVRQRGRGRPAHKRSRESVNRVILGLARGWSVKEVAMSIGVSTPTLREHYSSELKRRAAMRLMMESVQLGRLNDQAAKGNVGAEKELMKALDRGRIEALAGHVADRGVRQSKPKPPGKKEAAQAKAAAVHGKYAPPEAPRLLN